MREEWARTACDSVVPRATHLIAPTPCAVNWFILASLAARDVISVRLGVKWLSVAPNIGRIRAGVEATADDMRRVRWRRMSGLRVPAWEFPARLRGSSREIDETRERASQGRTNMGR